MLRNGAKIAIIAVGSTDPAILESRDLLLEKNIRINYLRLKALPVSGEVMDFIRNHERIYVIEMNRDGQLHQILSLEMPEYATSLVSLTHNDGLPITAKWVSEAIQAKENK